MANVWTYLMSKIWLWIPAMALFLTALPNDEIDGNSCANQSSRVVPPLPISLSTYLFRLLSQEWCWWFPRMRAPASVYFVYFVKSISPECLVDLLNSNVVCCSKRRKIIARTKDWRSRRRGKDNSRNSKIYPMCSDDDGVALKLANPRILYI